VAANVCRNACFSVAAFSKQPPQVIAGTLRENHAAVQRIVPSLNYLVRGAEALQSAVASRSNITHSASLDKTERIGAGHWLRWLYSVLFAWSEPSRTD
jgi:hypothetical protein